MIENQKHTHNQYNNKQPSQNIFNQNHNIFCQQQVLYYDLELQIIWSSLSNLLYTENNPSKSQQSLSQNVPVPISQQIQNLLNEYESLKNFKIIPIKADINHKNTKKTSITAKLNPQFDIQISTLLPNLKGQLNLSNQNWTSQNIKNSQIKAENIKSVLIRKSIKITQLFKKTHTNLAQSLNISQNVHQTIITKINHINFPNLLHLNLSSNKIQSLQPLISLNSINLKTLNLSHNHICYISPLIKFTCHCQNIQILELYKNFIVDPSHAHNQSIIQRCFLPKLKILKLELFPTSFTIFGGNLSWIFKTDFIRRPQQNHNESNNFVQLCKQNDKIDFQSKGRIKKYTDQITPILKQAFPNIKIKNCKRN